ncbi:hypothetical protein AVEN_179427-1 [Araneus ventricosus]|uniref:Uncharacterized protein n=1 Tax=Araneus ventricosus TaxID=182803 RepID=A0A4Y2BEW6_ARAVE|nr:hypothetical protein AVEN_179427-1 [Araneus ventricosus]
MGSALTFLTRYNAEGDGFLKSIFSGDETCIQYFNPEKKITVKTMEALKLTKQTEEVQTNPYQQECYCYGFLGPKSLEVGSRALVAESQLRERRVVYSRSDSSKEWTQCRLYPSG